MTQCHIPEEWNSQPHHCENLKTHTRDAHTGMLPDPYTQPGEFNACSSTQ